MTYRLFIGVDMSTKKALSKEEVLNVMKNDLYSANQRIEELEMALTDILEVEYQESGSSDIKMREIDNEVFRRKNHES